MTTPAVSVIVPCYNAEAYLASCAESVFAQTEQSWELLLVNDGSTDGTSALCRALAEKDGRVRVIEQENAGVSAARNAGLDMIGVAWGFRGRAALEAAGAPLVADTPAQLLDMLLA